MTATTESASVLLLPLGQLDPDPVNPRWDPGDVDDLAASIVDQGVLQPLLVRPDGAGRYRVVAGSRRRAAAAQAGLDVVPCVVRDLDDVAAAIAGGTENLARSDLNPIEEAELYRHLLDATGLPQVALAGRLGVSPATMAQRLKLLELPPETQELVADGTMSLQAAYRLVKQTRGALAKRRRRQHEITEDDVDVLSPIVVPTDLLNRAREQARQGRNEPVETLICRALRREIAQPSCDRCTAPSIGGGHWCRRHLAEHNAARRKGGRR